MSAADLTFFAAVAGLVIGLLWWIGIVAGAALSVLREIRSQMFALEEQSRREQNRDRPGIT